MYGAPLSGETMYLQQGYSPAFYGPMRTKRKIRQRMNVVPIILACIIPPLVFVAMFALLSFELRFRQPALVYFLVILTLVIIVSRFLMMEAFWRRFFGAIDREPSWNIFLTATCLMAWIIAIVFGDDNYWENTAPYYQVANLGSYKDVEVSSVTGQQLMDSGLVVFTNQSKLDLNKWGAFKDKDIYCVAPVTSKNASLANYDFWAVGKNCCSGLHADFHCGDYNTPQAHSGLRMMKDDERPYYRLAVMAATQKHNITAAKPLFFEWMQDPKDELDERWDDGVKWFVVESFAFFILQILLTMIGTIAWSRKAGYRGRGLNGIGTNI